MEGRQHGKKDFIATSSPTLETSSCPQTLSHTGDNRASCVALARGPITTRDKYQCLFLLKGLRFPSSRKHQGSQAALAPVKTTSPVGKHLCQQRHEFHCPARHSGSLGLGAPARRFCHKKSHSFKWFPGSRTCRHPALRVLPPSLQLPTLCGTASPSEEEAAMCIRVST